MSTLSLQNACIATHIKYSFLSMVNPVCYKKDLDWLRTLRIGVPIILFSILIWLYEELCEVCSNHLLEISSITPYSFHNRSGGLSRQRCGSRLNGMPTHLTHPYVVDLNSPAGCQIQYQAVQIHFYYGKDYLQLVRYVVIGHLRTILIHPHQPHFPLLTHQLWSPCVQSHWKPPPRSRSSRSLVIASSSTQLCSQA